MSKQHKCAELHHSCSYHLRKRQRKTQVVKMEEQTGFCWAIKLSCNCACVAAKCNVLCQHSPSVPSQQSPGIYFCIICITHPFEMLMVPLLLLGLALGSPTKALASEEYSNQEDVLMFDDPVTGLKAGNGGDGGGSNNTSMLKCR